MSRIGLKPIPIPDKVTIEQKGSLIEVKGPKGALTETLPDRISLEIKDSTIILSRESEERSIKAKHGLIRALLANDVKGVSEGYEKRLEIIGIGYRAAKKGKNIELSLGYSHPVIYPIPEGIDINVEENTKIVVTGIDKQKVGQIAAEIRAFRRPEPYKGKGIRYDGEVVRKKVGKATG